MDRKRPSCTKQINRVHYIRIEICRSREKQVRLVLTLFASTKLALYYIKQAQCN